MPFDLDTLRQVLIITLSILVVILAYRRFKERVVARDLPVAAHVELIALNVAYHPVRLLVMLEVPREQDLESVLLDTTHAELFRWPVMQLERGKQTIELPLEGDYQGDYYLEVGSFRQRTLRRFHLQHV